MSWDRTYSHNVLYGLDCFGAILFWNQPDITISSLCRLVQLNKISALKLYGWQHWILKQLAPVLNWIQTNHCELARLSDIARAKRTLALLE